MISRGGGAGDESDCGGLLDPATWLGVFTLLAGLGLLWSRIHQSVDFTDEAFYTALAYRFALGDTPFVDEVAPAQTAALIVTPFVWAYVKVFGGTAGIVLFARKLFLAFKLIEIIVVYRSLRTHLSRGPSLGVAAVVASYVPFATPSLGYNQQAAGFLTMGLFALAGAVSRERVSSLPFILAGLCLGLGTLAYPTLLPAVAVAVGCAALVARGHRLRVVMAIAVGGVIVVLLFLPILLNAGLSAVRGVFEYGSAVHARPLSKFPMVLREIRAQVLAAGLGWPLLLVFCAAGLAFRFLAPLAAAALLAYPALLKNAWPILDGPYRVLVLAAFAPVLFAMTIRDSRARTLFFVVWPPSAVAALMCAYSSGNGALNAGMGGAPAAYLAVVLLAAAGERVASTGWGRVFGRVVAVLGAGFVAVSFNRNLATTSYRDLPPGRLDTKVASGPFAGMSTTSAKAAFVVDFERRLRALETPNSRVAIYYEFPAGYLMTSRPPALNTVWPVAFVDQAPAVKWLKKRNPTGVAIKMGAFPGRVTAVASLVGPLESYVEDERRKIFDERTFKAYRLPEPTRK